MKRFICILISALCITACCTSCSNSPKVTVSEPEPDRKNADMPSEMTVGWNCEIAMDGVLPDEVQSAFDKAFEGFTGASYRPVVYLGSQIVAGTN